MCMHACVFLFPIMGLTALFGPGVNSPLEVHVMAERAREGTFVNLSQDMFLRCYV